MQNISPVNSQTNAGIDLYGSKMYQTDISYHVAVPMLVSKNVCWRKTCKTFTNMQLPERRDVGENVSEYVGILP